MLILVVEDEPVQALTLELALADAGHDILGPASTIGTALKLIEHTRPDLALVDICLGDRLDGASIARETWSRWQTPVIFASASHDTALENRDVALGYLENPYTAEELLATVDVAQSIMAGGAPPPPPIPSRLQLF